MITKEKAIELMAEIVEKTASGYNKNTRSLYECPDINESVCSYRDCAFARCCTDKARATLVAGHENRNASEVLRDLGRGILIEKYKPLADIANTCFWDGIQALHDHLPYWNDRGLSKKGMSEKKYLLNHIESGFFFKRNAEFT